MAECIAGAAPLSPRPLRARPVGRRTRADRLRTVDRAGSSPARPGARHGPVGHRPSTSGGAVTRTLQGLLHKPSDTSGGAGHHPGGRPDRHRGGRLSRNPRPSGSSLDPTVARPSADTVRARRTVGPGPPCPSPTSLRPTVGHGVQTTSSRRNRSLISSTSGPDPSLTGRQLFHVEHRRLPAPRSGSRTGAAPPSPGCAILTWSRPSGHRLPATHPSGGRGEPLRRAAAWPGHPPAADTCRPAGPL